MYGFEKVVYKLPKGYPTSKDIKRTAIAYYRYTLFGNEYYAPITAESKKLLRFKVRKGKIVFESYMQEKRLGKYLGDVTLQSYYAIRDFVGQEVYKDLDRNIKQGLENMYQNELEKRIKKGIEKKMLKQGGENEKEK